MRLWSRATNAACWDPAPNPVVSGHVGLKWSRRFAPFLSSQPWFPKSCRRRHLGFSLRLPSRKWESPYFEYEKRDLTVHQAPAGWSLISCQVTKLPPVVSFGRYLCVRLASNRSYAGDSPKQKRQLESRCRFRCGTSEQPRKKGRKKRGCSIVFGIGTVEDERGGKSYSSTVELIIARRMEQDVRNY